jgi:hypothetical protein
VGDRLICAIIPVLQFVRPVIVCDELPRTNRLPMVRSGLVPVITDELPRTNKFVKIDEETMTNDLDIYLGIVLRSL